MRDRSSGCYQISRAWADDVYNREHTGSNLRIHPGCFCCSGAGLTCSIKGSGPYVQVSRWQASRGKATPNAYEELLTASPAEKELLIFSWQITSVCMGKNIKVPSQKRARETEQIYLFLSSIVRAL